MTGFLFTIEHVDSTMDFAVGLAELMTAKQNEPEGKLYWLLLTDGKRTDGQSDL